MVEILLIIGPLANKILNDLIMQVFVGNVIHKKMIVQVVLCFARNGVVLT
jgi:hypothetical protein